MKKLCNLRFSKVLISSASNCKVWHFHERVRTHRTQLFLYTHIYKKIKITQKKNNKNTTKNIHTEILFLEHFNFHSLLLFLQRRKKKYHHRIHINLPLEKFITSHHPTPSQTPHPTIRISLTQIRIERTQSFSYSYIMYRIHSCTISNTRGPKEEIYDVYARTNIHHISVRWYLYRNVFKLSHKIM